MKAYNITPYPKPRMTRSDKWNKRPCVVKYREFCDKVRASGLTLNQKGYWVEFIMLMPKSWSEKKKREHLGTPHTQTPDKDNLEKALLDAKYSNDSHMWCGGVSKRWGASAQIRVWNLREFFLENHENL